jgi:hypothetical protein
MIPPPVAPNTVPLVWFLLLQAFAKLPVAQMPLVGAAALAIDAIVFDVTYLSATADGKGFRGRSYHLTRRWDVADGSLHAYSID